VSQDADYDRLFLKSRISGAHLIQVHHGI
jgi:hypothetical protein